MVDRAGLVGVQDSPYAATVDAAGPSFVAAAALPEGFGPEAPGGFALESFAPAVRSEPAEVEQLGPAFVAVAAAVVSRFCAAAIFAQTGGT